jgi:hypothetical protein
MGDGYSVAVSTSNPVTTLSDVYSQTSASFELLGISCALDRDL